MTCGGGTDTRNDACNLRPEYPAAAISTGTICPAATVPAGALSARWNAELVQFPLNNRTLHHIDGTAMSRYAACVVDTGPPTNSTDSALPQRHSHVGAYATRVQDSPLQWGHRRRLLVSDDSECFFGSYSELSPYVVKQPFFRSGHFGCKNTSYWPEILVLQYQALLSGE
jgi:hypothetical protein